GMLHCKVQCSMRGGMEGRLRSPKPLQESTPCAMLPRIPDSVPGSIAHGEGCASVLDQRSCVAPAVTMPVSDDTTEHHERQPARSRSGHTDRPQRTDHLRRLPAVGHLAV